MNAEIIIGLFFLSNFYLKVIGLSCCHFDQLLLDVLIAHEHSELRGVFGYLFGELDLPEVCKEVTK